MLRTSLSFKLSITRTPRPVVAALAAVAVPAPLLVGHHHHHHPKHHPAPPVKHAQPAPPKKSPTAQAKHHHRLAGLTGKKPSLVLHLSTGSQASGAADKTPAAHAAGDPSDSIVDYKFEPASITVHVGDTITWTNNGQQPHTATANNGSFNTGTIKPGSSASHTFSTAGTFAYICSIHPFMHGTVVVVANSSSNSGGGSGSNGGGSNSGGSNGGSGSGSGSGSSSPTSSSNSTPSSSSGTTASNTGSSTSSGTLPNTGLDLSAAVLIALGMIGGGMMIRRRVRQS